MSYIVRAAAEFDLILAIRSYDLPIDKSKDLKRERFRYSKRTTGTTFSLVQHRFPVLSTKKERVFRTEPRLKKGDAHRDYSPSLEPVNNNDDGETSEIEVTLTLLPTGTEAGLAPFPLPE